MSVAAGWEEVAEIGSASAVLAVAAAGWKEFAAGVVTLVIPADVKSQTKQLSSALHIPGARGAVVGCSSDPLSSGEKTSEKL